MRNGSLRRWRLHSATGFLLSLAVFAYGFVHADAWMLRRQTLVAMITTSSGFLTISVELNQPYKGGNSTIHIATNPSPAIAYWWQHTLYAAHFHKGPQDDIEWELLGFGNQTSSDLSYLSFQIPLWLFPLSFAAVFFRRRGNKTPAPFEIVAAHPHALLPLPLKQQHFCPHFAAPV
jgi:hypothetical protein